MNVNEMSGHFSNSNNLAESGLVGFPSVKYQYRDGFIVKDQSAQFQNDKKKKKEKKKPNNKTNATNNNKNNKSVMNTTNAHNNTASQLTLN